MNESDIYIASVCLERNRWGSRHPSFQVSEWIPRFRADGFDGVELWENHFLEADEEERRRLIESAFVRVFNTYAGFTDADEDARRQAADTVSRLGAKAVKFNVGAERDRLNEYRRHLRAWIERLPAACLLLCECHRGTAIERPAEAADFLADFDPRRVGVIAHVTGEIEDTEPWFETFRERVRHLHVQFRTPEADPSTPVGRERLDAVFACLRARGFSGSATIEFTRGIGRDERIETLYANAVTDLAYCRRQLNRSDG